MTSHALEIFSQKEKTNAFANEPTQFYAVDSDNERERATVVQSNQTGSSEIFGSKRRLLTNCTLLCLPMTFCCSVCSFSGC